MWTRALELDPETISSRYSRVFLLQRLGRVEEAIAEWEAIVECNSRTATPCTRSGRGARSPTCARCSRTGGAARRLARRDETLSTADPDRE